MGIVAWRLRECYKSVTLCDILPDKVDAGMFTAYPLPYPVVHDKQPQESADPFRFDLQYPQTRLKSACDSRDQET